jgi:hypothetical protein
MEQLGRWFRGEHPLSEVPLPKPGFWDRVLHALVGERWKPVDMPQPQQRR